jgi:hypothetical protein
MPVSGAYTTVEVWLSEPSEKRAAFSHAAVPLEYLPVDAPLPRVGDLVVLPRNVTGDDPAQAFAYGGTRTPFRVVECEYVYARETNERIDAVDPRPARHVKTIIMVERMTEKEFYDDRGWHREPAG